MKQVLFVLALGVFGIATTEFGVIGILPQLASAFKVSIDKAGWLLSAFALTVAVFGPFMVLLVSSYNRKKLLTMVLGVFALSNVLSIFATNFTFLLIARVIPAFFHPVFWSIALTTAAGIVPQHEAPRAVSIVFGGFTIASVLGIPLATFAADLFNWQASFILSAIINGISFFGLLFFLPSVPQTAAQQPANQVQVLKKVDLWMNLVLACLLVAAMYASYGYMADYLGRVTKMSGTQISIMLFVFGITGVAGNRMAGKMMSKNIFSTTLFFVIALSVVHVLLYVFGSYFIPMAVMIGVWGLVHTGGFLISNVNVTSSAPEAPEFVNSIFTSCGNFAVTIGSILGGFWITRFGVHEVVWSSILLLMLSLLLLGFKQVRRR